MTLTHKIYEELYNSIQEINESALSKMYKNNRNIPLIYAVSREDECRKLYFPISEADVNGIPLCHGMDVNKVNLYEYSKVDYFCELSQKSGAESDVFEVIIEDIRKNSDDVEVKEKMALKVSNILLKWKSFFSQDRDIVLSSERQQGLYGELLFLNQLIEWYGPIAVGYWTGCDYETHDYYIHNNAVEVKTTITKEPYKMHISSEYQLDETEIDGQLFAVFYALRQSSADGETLPEIIAKIRKTLMQNNQMLLKFNSSLEAYGYYDGVEHKYSLGYHIRETQLYSVKDEFPRILKEQLSVGITNCSYSVLTSSCKQYKIDKEKLKIHLKGKNE